MFYFLNYTDEHSLTWAVQGRILSELLSKEQEHDLHRRAGEKNTLIRTVQELKPWTSKQTPNTDQLINPVLTSSGLYWFCGKRRVEPGMLFENCRSLSISRGVKSVKWSAPSCKQDHWDTWNETGILWVPGQVFPKHNPVVAFGPTIFNNYESEPTEWRRKTPNWNQNREMWEIPISKANWCHSS